MSTTAYYREEARRYRDLAAASPGSEAAKHWLRFAADYDVLADLLEDGDDTAAPVLHRPTQQQPMQQQRKKKPVEIGAKSKWRLAQWIVLFLPLLAAIVAVNIAMH
jgi:hypothetical protein